ncbi:MAG: DUF4288 domain-containing protein [Anaerolineae bacterium]
MAYIPQGAKWYLAEIVQQIVVDGDDSSLVHVNLTLIRADSPEEAYERSLEVGRQGEMAYQNTDGKTVAITFRGLRNLHVIHEQLEHGSEILHEEIRDLSESDVTDLLRSKAHLNIFRPRVNVD